MTDTVLLTGFEPFDGETINPSWEAARLLDGQRIGGARVVARRLPCVFGASLTALNDQLRALRPRLVLCAGQAGGRAEIAVERVAINLDDARIPDNAGRQPLDQPIAADGPAAYFATVPVKAIVAALQDAGLPAVLSHSAGTFVCNHVFYGLLRALSDEPDARGGFIHLPCLPEQAAGRPSLPLERCVQALELAIAASLGQTQGSRAIGGSLY